MKVITALFICMALLLSNVANAATPCCMKSGSEPAASAQIEHAPMDMPCHGTAANESEDQTACDNCDCQHCVKMPALPSQSSALGQSSSNMLAFGAESVHSRQAEAVFQPPKQIS